MLWLCDNLRLKPVLKYRCFRQFEHTMHLHQSNLDSDAAGVLCGAASIFQVFATYLPSAKDDAHLIDELTQLANSVSACTLQQHRYSKQDLELLTPALPSTDHREELLSDQILYILDYISSEEGMTSDAPGFDVCWQIVDVLCCDDALYSNCLSSGGKLLAAAIVACAFVCETKGGSEHSEQNADGSLMSHLATASGSPAAVVRVCAGGVLRLLFVAAPS